MNVVFAIGCKRYRDPDVAQLKYADQDAKRFVETVMGTQDPDNTEKYLLHDEHENEGFRPTRANILYFLFQGERRDKSTELDFLFFYFSGHGWSSQDGTDYLLTSDSLVSMPEYTAISVPMLESHLRKWEAKHVVLFIDACRTVMAGGKSITIEDESRINVDSLCPPGMVTFCSCEPGQTSYEADPIGSGVFTEGVCKALSDEGRCSTIQELDAYLSDNVPRISAAYGLPRQLPYSRVEPLAVQKALIVSQRIKEAWQTQEENKEAVQSPLGPTTQEEPLGRYREFVRWVWTGEQLSERDVQRLSTLAGELRLSADTTAYVEREVMGDTKEAMLERDEHKRNLGVLYEQGQRYLDDEEWAQALQSFGKVNQLQPDYAEGWAYKASALNGLKRYEEAIEACEMAISLKPDLAVAWFNKADALTTRSGGSRYQEAIEAYDKAISLEPDYSEAWFYKGQALHSLKRYQEAIEAYDKAISLEPDYGEAWVFKAYALTSLGRYQEAIEACDKILNRKPDYVFALRARKEVQSKVQQSKPLLRRLFDS
jgi:tetratricopeptide (TPR) repeat protein